MCEKSVISRILDIEQFSYLEKRFILDIQTSYLLEVDNIFYDWISVLRSNKSIQCAKQEFSTIYGAKSSDVFTSFENLIENGFLNYKNTVNDTILQTNSCLHSLQLMISHTCNLACTYCYADKGTYGTSEGLMNFNTAQKAVDFLIANSGKVNDIEISFFGGEPFLNFDLIKKLIKYIADSRYNTCKNFHYSITTNGTILTKTQLDFLKEHNFLITLTIDGPKDVHNKCRIFKDGSGSFDIIKKNLLKLKAENCNVIPQTIIAPELSNNALEILKYVAYELGFSHISVGECFDSSKKEIRKKWLDSENDNYFKELQNLAREIVKSIKTGTPVMFTNQLMRIMLGIDQHDKKLFNCSSATNSFVSVTPTGDIYPCQMLIGHKEFLLGNVHKNTYRNISIQPSIKTDCCDCWLRYICSGGCYALAFLINGDVNKRKINDICKKIQEMYKCGAYIYSCLSENEFKKIIDIWCRTSGF